MSTYALDEQRAVITATWPTGTSYLTSDVLALPDEIAPSIALHVAAALTDLSQALWQRDQPVYSKAEDEEVEVGVDEAQLQALLRRPPLPDPSGYVVQFYGRIEHAAHHLGRLLVEAGSGVLTDAVVASALDEYRAITAADLGDLSGRAAQAIAHPRVGVSPTQVRAAHDTLVVHPLGSNELFETVEHGAAAVAAAHWLHAAAIVTAEAIDCPVTELMSTSDEYEAFNVDTPQHVLELLESGQSAVTLVTDLMRDALEVRAGRIPDIERLAVQLHTAQQEATRYGIPVSELAPRLCLIDPMNPGHDLLEDLLGGIQACLTLWIYLTDVGDEAQTSSAFIEAVRDQAAGTAGNII